MKLLLLFYYYLQKPKPKAVYKQIAEWVENSNLSFEVKKPLV